MSDMEAVERLGNEAAAPQGMLGSGVAQSNVDDDARSWPDGLEVASFPHGRADGHYPAETLLAVGRLVNAEANTEVIGRVVARAAMLLTGAGDVAVYHVEPDGDQLTILARDSVTSTDATERVGETALPESLHVSTDRRPTPVELGQSPALHRAEDARRAIYVPLHAGGRVVGAILAVDWAEQGGGIEPTLDVLEALAHVVAGPLALALSAPAQPIGTAYPLEALQRTAEAVAHQSDLEGVLRTIGDGLRSHVPHQIIAAFRSDNQARTLQRVFIDVTDPAIQVNGLADLKFGEAMTGRVALSGRPLLVNNAHRDRRVPLPQIQRKGSQIAFQRLHLMAIPLLAGGNLLGVVTLLRLDDASFTTHEFTFAQVFAGLATSAMQDAKRALMQQERYLGGLRALVAALDAKDVYSRGHSERVSRLARAIAETMALPPATIDQVELGGLMHDIGKIGIPDGILQKVSPLDDAERAVMMGHTELGAAILADSGSSALHDVIPLVRHHHEWFDGRGYPKGLAGEAIPLGAAIIGVADAFVSMTTDRAYQTARTYEEALAELDRGSGTQFHPAVVAATQQLASTGRLPTHVTPLTDRLLVTTRASEREHGSGLGPVSPMRSPAPEVDLGQLGDLRALGLMIELAGITSLIPELPAFLDRVADVLSRRLGLENVMVLLCDQDNTGVTVAAQSGAHAPRAVGEHLPFGHNPWTEVCRTGASCVLPDLGATSLDTGATIGSALVVPLTAQDETIGMLYVAAERPGAFTSGDTTVLMAVAGQIASSIHVAQVHDAIKSAALTDGLTGLTNYRAFYQALEVATRDQQPIGVLLFDVIGLKRVNDTSSHLDGDLLLRTVARTIRSIVRPSDVVARYGGDEFAVILHGPISDASAIGVGERVNNALREALDELGLPTATLRFGVAMLPVDGITPHELVLAADRRMYLDDSDELGGSRVPNGHARVPDIVPPSSASGVPAG